MGILNFSHRAIMPGKGFHMLRSGTGTSRRPWVLGLTLAVMLLGACNSPKTEAPKTEAPKAEAPKAEAPKAEAPKAEAPKTQTPEGDAAKAEAPKQEASINKEELVRLAKLNEQNCTKGDQDACYKLGVAYAQGLGVTKDAERSASLLQECV